MTNPTDSFAQDGAIAAASVKLGLAPEPADTVEYPQHDPRTRHVLIVEPDGWTYLAPHTVRHGQEPACVAVAHAARVFADHGTPPRPGRFWCSVDEHGNLEIGGEVRS